MILGRTVSRTIFVILAVYRPRIDFLRDQIDSILTQQYEPLRLVIVVDGSDPVAEAELQSLRDNRILTVCPTVRRGALRAFELGLETAIQESRSPDDCFAFADQDDVWEPHKLTRLMSEIEKTNCMIAFSDAAVIDSANAVIARSIFALEIRLKDPTLGNLLVSNSVSGMSMLLQKRLALLSLPFPLIGNGAVLHDWWIAVLGRSLGEIRFISEPLVRYRLHDSNLIGPRMAGSAKRSPTIAGDGRFRRWVNQFRLRQQLARNASRTMVGAGLNAPRTLDLVARAGVGGFFTFLLQSTFLLARGNARMSSIALGSAIGCLYARFAGVQLEREIGDKSTRGDQNLLGQ
jgi:glycosyltransferase involved in cell wall biosynthesis